MDEPTWLTCNEPWAMVWASRYRVTPRKARLLGVAFCRRVHPLLIDERSRLALEVSEHVAEQGLASSDELRAAYQAAKEAEAELAACVLTSGPPRLQSLSRAHAAAASAADSAAYP